MKSAKLAQKLAILGSGIMGFWACATEPDESGGTAGQGGTTSRTGGAGGSSTGGSKNAPSIHGNQTFTQYYSVRRVGRQCGHISISQHSAEWASQGMPPGKMYEVKVLAEGMNGGGSVDFTKATVAVTR